MSKNYDRENLLMCLFTGLSLGLLGGLLLGIMVAPDSGERTRKKFIKRAEKLKDHLSERISTN